MSALRTAALAALCGAAACGRPEPPSVAPSPASSTARDVVLFLGDSLTAGYGVDAEEAYPALLEERWKAAGRAVRARNAGVSGTTTAGVLENLDWSLTPEVAVAIVAIGANDGMRGQDLAAVERNIDAILARVKAAGVRPVLAGMMLPPNYGEEYCRRFAALYPRAARRAGAALIPFVLEGVAGVKEFNQSDGIHPNAAGHRRIADTVAAALEKEGLP
ncbi:MAG: arylesterase [Elusimicrobia bacterium]|nr:arylesterase [Elusimicrobiota bacterium]